MTNTTINTTQPSMLLPTIKNKLFLLGWLFFQQSSPDPLGLGKPKAGEERSDEKTTRMIVRPNIVILSREVEA